MADTFWLEKVSDGPERFWIRWPAQDETKPGLRFRSTEALNETDLRMELSKLGITPMHADQLVQQAREKFASEATAI